MKININWKIGLVFFSLITAGFVKNSSAQQKFEKAAFYNAMDSGDNDALDSQIAIVQNSSLNNKEGYEGALLMKKASLASTPKKKLKFFKDGRIKLETALLADNGNTEFHFLRLAIEEHAPKIVRYHNDIDADKLVIQKNFKSLSPAVQHAILDYCKKSKVLHAEEL
jgi:hypothetical protein